MDDALLVGNRKGQADLISNISGLTFRELPFLEKVLKSVTFHELGRDVRYSIDTASFINGNYLLAAK
jgi:hypothetical protein